MGVYKHGVGRRLWVLTVFTSLFDIGIINPRSEEAFIRQNISGLQATLEAIPTNCSRTYFKFSSTPSKPGLLISHRHKINQYHLHQNVRPHARPPAIPAAEQTTRHP